jgi:tyrosine-protein kinase Etk/Wzc
MPEQQLPKSNYVVDHDFQENALEKNQQLQFLLFRLFPFWPLIAISLLCGITAGYLLLRYANAIYQVKARIVVNDDSQQKSTNLQEIIKLDTRNISSETEREMEILRSTDLLKKVASNLQLNIILTGIGSIKSSQIYHQQPVRLILATPDSVKKSVSGQVTINKNKIIFLGKEYPVDSVVATEWGDAKWHIYPEYARPDKIVLSIVPTLNIARQMKGALTVAPISKGSTILDLSYTDVFTDRASQILNELINVYGNTVVDYKGRIYENTQKFLDGRLALVSSELSDVEKRMQNFREQQKIIDLSEEGKIYLNKLRQADTKIGEIEVQLEVLNEIEKYVNKRNNTVSPVPATLGITDQVLVGLLTQLYQAEFELEKVKEISGDKNPQIEVYEKLVNRLRPSIASSISNLKINLFASKKKLEADNNEINGTISRIPEKEKSMLDISRQQSIKNAIYTFLLQKKEESAIAAASIVPNYRIIEKADTGRQVAPNRQNYYALSIATALLLAALYIYLKEFANSRLLFRSQIESRLSLPIIGELIYKDTPEGGPVVVGEGKRTLIAEQFRELRTNISYAIPAAIAAKKAKTILVTSSVPAEGKSFVSINTAVSFCLTGARVVLLEFDLRKPKISKPLGIKREPGITNFLVGNAQMDHIVQKHATIENFYILASGPVPPNPAELITSAKMKELMVHLQNEYDYIIIDSPPVASVTDAKLLAVWVDLTLYIVRHNFTNSVFLKLIGDVSAKGNVPNMNIVFNGIVNKKVMGYGYGKGYGYGYGYGYAYGYGYGYGYTIDEPEKTGLQKLLSKFRKSKK